MNAFLSVRPRGTTTSPSPKPSPLNRGPEPPKIGKSAQVAMDRSGRRTVSLEPMPSKIHINSPKESAAQQYKLARIREGKTK